MYRHSTRGGRAGWLDRWTVIPTEGHSDLLLPPGFGRESVSGATGASGDGAGRMQHSTSLPISQL